MAKKRAFADALQNHRLGRVGEAERLYRQVLTDDPRHAESLHLLGVLAHQTRRPALAVEMISRAIAINANVASYHSNLASAHYGQGRLAESVVCLRNAIGLDPHSPEIWYNLGNALREQGRPGEAIGCYRSAIAIRPDYPVAHSNLGSTLHEQGRLDEALACFRKALDVSPDNPEIQNNLGITLKEQWRLDEAVACYRSATNLRPNYPEAHNNLGVALKEQRRLDEALACYRKALELRPDYPEAHNNMGVLLLEMRRLDDAVACYRSAIDIRPDYPDAHYNLSLALLARGDMVAGWNEHEWRWKTPQGVRERRTFEQRQWQGEAGRGQTLLVHAEQGLGDTLQFCRYAPLAAERGLDVILEVPKPLVRLLRGLRGTQLVVEDGGKLPAFDFHCPMLSMPLALGAATIPSCTPYLYADEAQAAVYQNRLQAMAKQGIRVGLVWAGNPRRHMPAMAAIDSRRSLAPEMLAPLLDLPGLHFLSLQKDGPKAPAGFPLTDLMDGIEDFADTAALIVNLDLVISVDTAAAHLAAALGKPVWLLDRFDSCWRWLAGRRDSPWYPTLRLYRQPKPGDWKSVLTEVVRDLGVGFGSLTQ